jgi:FkbM family methyltransferase
LTISIEANPELVERAKERLGDQIASKKLICVNVAISPEGKAVALTLCGTDLGSSSLYSNRIAHMQPTGAITVPGVTLHQLFEEHGVPEYLKVDIEGADRLCVLSLTSDKRPTFLSFEVGDDVDELISHAEAIGYHRFKIISQISFRELANERSLYDRLKHRLTRYMGYDDPVKIKRGGHFFAIGHSSGPVPWQSDGLWRSGSATRSRLCKAKATNSLLDWYDIHATTL